ncbi:hypothetical protein BRARA_B02132 [Brassica rapa]|uniref:Uncharacterized protein n=1 Tax=Brassica campestris TaxID=3711 RepID=A0A398AC56_BRACM|nr:hypothetical protein BRARA_B02132 [Brassica rapa]
MLFFSAILSKTNLANETSPHLEYISISALFKETIQLNPALSTNPCNAFPNSNAPDCEQAERTPVKLTSFGLISPRLSSLKQEKASWKLPLCANPTIIVLQETSSLLGISENTRLALSTSPALV